MRTKLRQNIKQNREQKRICHSYIFRVTFGRLEEIQDFYNARREQIRTRRRCYLRIPVGEVALTVTLRRWNVKDLVDQRIRADFVHKRGESGDRSSDYPKYEPRFRHFQSNLSTFLFKIFFLCQFSREELRSQYSI